MARIVVETEESPYDDVPIEEAKMAEDAVGGAANFLSRASRADAFLVATLSGASARLVSRFRPEIPIFAATPSEFIRRQLNLTWSIIPFVVSKSNNIDSLISRSITKIKKERLVKKGSKIIVLAGQPIGKRVNLVEMKEI
jgi:pyruvate kinase